MRQKSNFTPASSETLVRNIRRATRKHHAAEEKIRIVLDGLRGETSIAELCRREGIAESMYYSWSKEGFEAYYARWPATGIQSIPDFCLPTIASHFVSPGVATSRSASRRSAKFDLEVGGKRSTSKNMRGELAQARPVTFSAAATAAGTRTKSA